MAKSYLQDEFLRVFADGHRATAERILRKISTTAIPADVAERIARIVREEVRGLYHGNLVVLDGGSSLADRGTIKIVDDEGVAFDRALHEIGLERYDENA